MNGVVLSVPNKALPTTQDSISFMEMGSLREYKPGKWKVYYYHPCPVSGKKRRWEIYSFNYKGKKISLDAKSLAIHVLELINNEVSNESHNPYHWQADSSNQLSFENLAKLYMDEIEAHKAKKRIGTMQAEKIKRHFSEYFIPHFGNRDITAINTNHLHNLANTVFPQDWHPKTAKNALDILHTFFNRLFRRNVISKLPDFGDIIGKIPKASRNFVSEEVQAQIIGLILEEHRNLYIIGCGHGMRPGEVRALQVRDINLDYGQYGQIVIQRAFSDDELNDTPKDKEARYLPINPELRPLVESLVKGKLPNAFLFTDAGKPYKRKRMYDIFAKTRNALGVDVELKNFMRTSFITNAKKRGVSNDAVARMAGHSDDKVTLQHYINMDTEDLGRQIFPTVILPLRGAAGVQKENGVNNGK